MDGQTDGQTAILMGIQQKFVCASMEEIESQTIIY
jgi:hypothetical protein